MMKATDCLGCQARIVLLGAGDVEGAICPKCIDKFLKKQGAVAGRIVRRGRPRKEPAGDCPKCGKVFFRPQGIKMHIKHCKHGGK
jgi:uncharacterized protein with PIN domain